MAVKSLPEYKKHESVLSSGLNFKGAIAPLVEAMTILENINQAEDYSYGHLLDRLSLMHFLNFEMDESEKYLLRSYNLKQNLHMKAGAEKNLLKLQLSNLYAYKDAQFAYEYASGEISQILDAKKDYYQDENYFVWLDTVAQKKWRFQEGTALTLI